MQCFTLIVRIH